VCDSLETRIGSYFVLVFAIYSVIVAIYFIQLFVFCDLNRSMFMQQVSDFM
jgi:hypothetical protein